MTQTQERCIYDIITINNSNILDKCRFCICIVGCNIFENKFSYDIMVTILLVRHVNCVLVTIFSISNWCIYVFI